MIKRNQIKRIVLKHKFLSELYFFITGKSINRTKLNRKIELLRCSSITYKQKIPDLIVSLTCYGERLNDLKYTLLSLVEQSIKPEKIIVWLANGEQIPEELEIFKKFDIEFKFCTDTKSYKKLVPALKEFPDKCIVTADDDIFYKKNWLKKLWNCHLENPKCKIAHRAHQVSFDVKKTLLPYNKWKSNLKYSYSGKAIFATGCGGVLYPPLLISEEFLNESLMMSLCPNADDVWFYFMGILSGQDTIVVSHPYTHFRYVDIYKEYGLNGKTTLQSFNVNQNMNDVQIRNVMNQFKLTDEKLFELITS